MYKKKKRSAVDRFLISCLVLKLKVSEFFRIKGINGKTSNKNESELIRSVTSYCLHFNQANISIGDSSVITCQNNMKLCTPVVRGKTELMI